ncbi:MAG TPA: undecaprenyl-diphosphate phosphatase, partial [Elusimicrobiales bacterium]|nr:undecaprenyl-diphosphate phosphatase [Elusimicrobiales bacterium]
SQTRSLADLSLKDAALIGMAQAIALLPGASRSGMTIMAALFLGYARRDAARISFLFATPVLLGAGLLEAGKISAADIDPAFLTGVSAAFLTGLASIKFLLTYLKDRTLKIFILYRVALGACILWSLR